MEKEAGWKSWDEVRTISEKVETLCGGLMCHEVRKRSHKMPDNVHFIFDWKLVDLSVAKKYL